MNPRKVYDWLDHNVTRVVALYFPINPYIEVLAEGNQTGADQGAGLWAIDRLGEHRHGQFEAHWHMFGDDAGTIRNRQMVNVVRPNLLIAFPGYHGTADMVRFVEDYNRYAPIPIHVFKAQGNFL